MISYKKFIKLEKVTEYLFYLFVFLLPWQTRWIIQSGNLGGHFWEYGSFSLFGTDILWLVILILFLLIKTRLAKRPALARLWPSLIGFLIICLFSVLVAFDRGIASYGFLKILEGASVFYLVTRLPLTILRTSLVLVSSACLQAGLAVWQLFSQQVLALKWLGLAKQLPVDQGVYVVENALGRFLRAYGSLHPIILSYFLVISLIITFGLYFWTRKIKQKIYVWSALYLILLGLVLTFGRVAWLSAAIGLISLYLMIWGLMSKRGKKKLALLALIIILGSSLFVVIFQEIVVTRLQMNERLEQVSINERSYYLQDAVNITKEHWYEGVGPYNFTQAVRREADGLREAWNYQPPNNLFILIMVETSIFGLITFLWLLGEIGRLVWHKVQKLNLKKDWWFIIYTVGLIILLITAFFDHTYWTLQFGLLFFWLILGLWARSLED